MQCVYHSIVKDVEELRERLISVWCEQDQSVVNHAIEDWRRRLLACVDAKGDILNITYDCYCRIIMSKCQHCRFDNWRCLFLFSFAVNINEQRIVAF